MDIRILKDFDLWLEAHKEEMFEDIASMVAIPTVVEKGQGGYPYGENLAKAIVQMSRLADRYGFEWENHQWHCISIRYGKGEKQLGIWGHLDIVPPGDGWIYKPFEMKQIKNYLLGRGTQDNKGPDIGSLYILRYLKEHHIDPGFEIRLIYGCQEESGMEDVAEYLKMEKAPTCSFVPDCGFPVCYGEKGFLKVKLKSAPLSKRITLLEGGEADNAIPAHASAVVDGEKMTFEGIGGHSAYPDRLENAFHKLGSCFEQMDLPETDTKAFAFLSVAGSDGYGRALGIDRSDEPSGAMTCAPTRLYMEDGCMGVTVNIRYPITMSSDAIVKDLSEKASDFGLCVTLVEDSKPNREDPKNPWILYLTECFEEVMGERQEPYTMSGGTYARKVPNAVGFGPGLPKDLTVLGLPAGHGECHQPDESQCIDTLLMAWKVYMYTVLKLIETGLPID